MKEEIAAPLWSRLETLGKLQDTETVLRTRTGENRHILLSSALVDLHGGPHAITTFVDITERELWPTCTARKERAVGNRPAVGSNGGLGLGLPIG